MTTRHLLAACTTIAAVLVSATASAQTLIAIDSSRQLSRIDPLTGAKTVLRTTSSNTVITASLTHDSLRRRVLVSSTANDRLYSLDVHTGVSTLIGPYGDDSVIMHAIEYDASTDTLYGASGGGTNNHLYVISNTTGAVTQFGNPGFTGYPSLGWDPVGNVLYATDSATASLYTIDRSNGSAALVGPLLGPTNPQALAVHPTTGVLYLLDNVAQSLFTVDKTTGQATLVGPYGGGNLIGLAWIPPSGSYAPFGAGCVGSLGVPGNAAAATPAIGATFAATLTNLPFDAAVFAIGFSNTTSSAGPLPIDLAAVGAPGCQLRVATDMLALVIGAPGSAQASYATAVPDLPSLLGLRFYSQAAAFDTVNAFGIVVSDAAAGVIGL